MYHVSSVYVCIYICYDVQISFEEFRNAMKEDMDKGNFKVESFSVGGTIKDSDYMN